jgi:hypothetical protein
LQLEVIEMKLSSVYEKHLKGLEQLCQEEKITKRECEGLRIQFYKYFGGEPTGRGDPENQIEPHVMDFNLNWKEIIARHSKIIFKGTPETQFWEDV